MTFPSPPWLLRGQAWLSLFRAAPPDEPRGTYAVAFVRYEPGGTLAYSELLVARRAGPGSLPDGLRATVRDIWVDSPTSREGGRALWSVPKELAHLRHTAGGLGPAGRHTWTASTDRSLATAEFVDLPGVAVRLPLRGSLRQPRTGGGVAVARVGGSGRSMPCLATWGFPADGPLGWLADRPPIVSARVRDFRVRIE